MLARFANPALRHELAQIAWDGSKKLPVRLLATIEDVLGAGRPVDKLAIPIAAWMLFVRRRLEAGQPLVDPLASRLADCVAQGIEKDVGRFLNINEVFSPTLASSATFLTAVQAAHHALRIDPLNAIR